VRADALYSEAKAGTSTLSAARGAYEDVIAVAAVGSTEAVAAQTRLDEIAAREEIERLQTDYARYEEQRKQEIAAAEAELEAIRVKKDPLWGGRFQARGWIERVSPTVDPASGNFRVTARLETGEPPDRLLPGMLVRLDIVTERHPDSLVVPKRAIRREGDRGVIFLVEGGVAREVEVEEGFTAGDYVEVLPLGEATLAEGAEVVVVGNRDLETGAEVAVRADGE